MRTGRVPLAALLLVLVSPVLQVSSTNDIYWEGEEYASNEFLEVKKHEEPTVLDSLKRFKRQWDFFGWGSTKEKEAETATDTVPDDNGSYGKDDADLDVGSGVPDKSDSEPREKTLRVTFLVMEPYITAYSNRDSPEFLNISRSLANAVDLLFESLPGTQRSSLVRIQSLVNDDFLCKVTLDIVTTRNEDTDTIKDILRNHIKNNGRLGVVAVRDGDFSAQLIDPGTTFDCDSNEFTCDENICLPMSVICNGRTDCRDGTDEYDCPVPEPSSPTTESRVDYDIDNNIDDKNNQRTDNENPDERTSYETTPDYRNTGYAPPETPNNNDQMPDNSYNQSIENPDNRNPYDQNMGRDVSNPYDQNTGRDVSNPYDQNAGSDNRNAYDQNTGRDVSNRYDQNAGPENRNPYGTNASPDNRYPYGTNASPDNQNPYGTNAGPDNRDPYDRNAGPDNRDPYGYSPGPDNRNPDQKGSPDSRSENPDNRNTVDQETDYWPRGDLGGTIDPSSTGAPGETDTAFETDIYDTTTTRIYNECPATHIRCDETRCVEATRRCDGNADCADGIDEAGCPSRECGADDYQCRSGNCIESSRRCDKVLDCPDQDDELGCDCRPDEFRCESDGLCIEERQKCDGEYQCADSSDERDCDTSRCPPERFTCNTGSRVQCADKCNNVRECDDGEDEENCDVCDHTCDDGTCLKASQICDGQPDCLDESDELDCYHCDGPDDFRCDSDECITYLQRCNGIPECLDRSDERNCNKTMITSPDQPCTSEQFKCTTNNVCIDMNFLCDGNHDCVDGSDEDNCHCPEDSFQCRSGECLSTLAFCDGHYDCRDGTDEQNCPQTQTTTSRIPDRYDTTTERYYPEYTYAPPGGNGGGRRPGSGSNADGGDSRYPDSGSNAGGGGSRYPDSGSNAGGGGSGYPESGSNTGGGGSRYPDSGSNVGGGGSRYPDSASNAGGGGSRYPGSGSNAGGGGSRYPDSGSNAGGGGSRYPDSGSNAGGGGSRYPDSGSNAGAGGSRYPDGGGSRYPDGGGSRYPDGGGSRYPDSGSNAGAGGSRYPDSSSSAGGGGNRYPDSGSNAGAGGSRYPDSGSNAGGDGSRYPDSGSSAGGGGSRYPDGGGSRYPDSGSNAGAGGSRYPDSGSNAGGDGSRYPDSGSSAGGGGSRYPDSGSSAGAGGSRYPDGGSNAAGGGSRYPDSGSSASGGGSRYPDSGPPALNLKTYPPDQSVRHVSSGGDVVFQCRDEGPLRANVSWTRDSGSLKSGSTDVRGRLEMFKVTEVDSGTYICQADEYLRYPGAQVRVNLQVESAPVTYRPPFPACQPYEATCGNGQCIPKSAVCDNNYDCADRSDEENCHHNDMCEPNQYKCNNRKCVLKTWMCDSEDDCGDGSDEQNCGFTSDGGRCSPVEFTCKSEDQCVPRSFHCDGHNDCQDGSDEVACSDVYVSSPPKPTNVVLNPGETLILTCEAVGVPTPLISWRLNWGHVPSKCTWTSERGIGVITCTNMQPDDSGAYSCEAINNKAATFAAPDAIVFVNKTDLCPRGYFNNEARSESECIRCFCFGKSNKCRSADLFTYNMPTPLGEGGTRLLGIKHSPTGDVAIDSSQPISNQYYYQPLRNGATVTKFGDTSSWVRSHPYLTLPESYNGNQLKSYGGHIKYTVSPHTQIYGFDDSIPTIIIKGKYGNLFHISRASGSRDLNIEARLTPEDWMKNSTSGYTPASREDIMMTLDEIEMILLRSDLNNAGVNITDFAMESAEHINMGLGAASLVEECTCPKEYEGLSCQKCASGYIRKKVGPWLGDCMPEECPPGTYGDPASGIPCKQCPCPLTNRENQFARTCSLGYDGSVICDCFPGYEGKHCEVCASGYEGNPMVPGNTCRPVVARDNCNPTGTKLIRPPDECVCKDHVQGRYCDQCKNDSFYLSSDFRHGCALCFCTGVSQQCMSSNLRRKTTSVQFNVPQIVDQVKIYNISPTGPPGAVRYTAPIETDLKPQLYRGDISLTDIDRSPSTIYYWSLPASFAGNKVTSYGGSLRYVLKNVIGSPDQRFRNSAADVQLISDNRLTFHYFGDFQASHEGILNASIQIVEKGWQRPDGKEVSREHFLLALADVKTILIKATYSPGTELASPVSASIETAEADGYGPTAFHVEQCTCPPGYIGTSCEDCAPGFKRSDGGLYLAHCEPCECNDKSTMCNPETGVCYDCADNTDGEQCELCKPGYELDPYGNCVEYRASTVQPCSCDPRGTTGPCDDSGDCYCKQNVEGDSCDRCRPGTFGLDSNYPDGCLSCYCSGVTTDCHEGNHYTRVPMAAPVLGDNYGGYAITDLAAEKVIKDNFVPMFQQSELMYTFSSRPDIDLYWSLPIFPGNRVLSYGGTISLRQKFNSDVYEKSERGTDVVLDGGDISIYWTNPNQFSSGVSYSYQVPLKEDDWYILNTANPATRSNFMSVLRNLKRVLVRATVVPIIYDTTIADVSMDSATQNYDAVLPSAKGIEICMCPPGYSGTSCESCQSAYYKDQKGYCRQCPCNGHNCQLDSAGQVVCNCQAPYTGYDCSTIGGDSSMTEPPRTPSPEPTVVVQITSPTIKIQEVGSSVNFTCQAQSLNSRVRLAVRWTKSDGMLPLDRTQIDENVGLLLISNLQVSDSGKYICETSDGINTAQAFATLKVPGNAMTMPSVEIFPPVKEYYEGDLIELECRVRGNPTPSIRWQRASNRPLPLSISYVDSRLVIESARVEDSGEYRCIASNTVGTSDRTAVITIRPRPLWPPRDKLTVSIPKPSVDEGQSIRIACTGTTNIPAGTIDWVRQDNAIFPSNVRSENGVLYIEYAIPDNQGVYICQSPLSDVAPIPILVTVNVQTVTPETYNISVSEDRLKIPTGGSGTVECIITGRPAPLIKWTKHDGSIGPDSSQRGNTLIINNAQESDQGYYRCEGTVNNKPVANIYVFVEIERREPPKVEIWPPEGTVQAVPLGGEHTLICRVTGGIPEPDVTWNRNGRPLSRFTDLTPQHELKFNKIEVNDEGEYTCTARNDAGSASASAVIKVRAIPEISITPSPYVQVSTGDFLNIECRASGYPEPLVSIQLGDYREVVAPTPGRASLRVSSASESDSGYYTCTATNAAGTIKEQFMVEVDRGDGGNDGGFESGSGDGEINPDTNVPYNPSEPDNSRKLVAIEGSNETIIYCSQSSDDNVRWVRADGQPFQRNVYQNRSRLIINNVSKADSGEYVCNIYNQYNEVQKAVYTSLIVNTSPKITLRPPTQTVHPGESPIVDCIVDGDDIIDITWQPLNPNPSNRVDTRSSRLIFHEIEVEDAGRYECIARSRYGYAKSTAEVIVSEDTDHTASVSHHNEQHAHVGAAVHLSCKVSQNNVRIVWSKDGRALPRSVRQKNDGSLFIRLAKKSDAGKYVCSIRDLNGRTVTSNYINLHIQGPRISSQQLVAIEQPRRQFRAGDKVDVLCKGRSRDIKLKWVRLGTNQYVPSLTYGDGVRLSLTGVTAVDAGVYRCIGMDFNNHTFYDDFTLEVQSGGPYYPDNSRGAAVSQYTARLSNSVVLPCTHNLEEPVTIDWRREFAPLAAELPTNQPNLYLNSVTEADAGTYVCRVSNSRATVEARAILTVTGVVPRFDGESFLSLPTLRDPYKQFEIEISFKPADNNGLILYNSENQGREGDYIGLQLKDGVPEFIMNTGTEPLVVRGDRPLQLNTWHTIRLSRVKSKVTMDVDNTGPFIAESRESWGLLELNQPLYIGGVPEYNQLPIDLAGASGFIGCASMLLLGREEKNIMMDSLERSRVSECNSCAPNLCLNNGVCQEARNERGYICICASGFAGLNCDRTGEACRPGLCGPGKCADTVDGYNCACPVTHTGRNCEERQSIEYPAFTGSAYYAIKPPAPSRTLTMSMRIKADSPVTDGIIMYCAESPRGHGGFTSLVVHDGRLEFRFDLGGGSQPVVLVSNRTLPANEWTKVHIARVGSVVSLRINSVHSFEQRLELPKQDLNLDTPIYVGGVDDSIILNNNVGVTGGFSGCITDFMLQGEPVDIVNSIQSANVKECNTYVRGDIPDLEIGCQCHNGGTCTSDSSTCTCPAGFGGSLCEYQVPSPMKSPRQPPSDPCAIRPCRNGGTCRPDLSSRMNHTCDCRLGFAGAYCQIELELHHSVAFNGNGYLELPANLLKYENLDVDPGIIALAISTSQDGVLLYQKEAMSRPYYGDYILLRIERGFVIFEWDNGGGKSQLSVNFYVNDGERHQIIVRLLEDGRVSLSVDGRENSGTSTGISSVMNADSNIYLGGMPDHINQQGYPGFTGCIHQIELMASDRGLNLGQVAVTGRNTQRCKETFLP